MPLMAPESAATWQWRGWLHASPLVSGCGRQEWGARGARQPVSAVGLATAWLGFRVSSILTPAVKSHPPHAHLTAEGERERQGQSR